MSDKLEREIIRGEQAKRLLSDNLIAEAKEHIDAELWRLFKETTPQDMETLQFVKSMQYFHSKYFGYFERAVIDGKIAKIKLQAEKKTLRETLRERVFG